MKVLRDPLWQFIGAVVSIIAVLVPLIAFTNPLILVNGIIIAIVILVIFFSNIRPNKTVFFRVKSDTIVLSINEEEVKGEVTILYKGDVVMEDIHLVILRLWNASSEPILPEEYKGNLIKLNFGKEAKVLSVQVPESEPLTVKEEIEENKLLQHDAGNIALKPVWLNSDNSITLKVLVTKFGGEVTTDETRIIVGGFVSDWTKSRYNTIKRRIDDFLSPIAIIIGFIIALDIIVLLLFILYNIFSTDISAILLKYNWTVLIIYVVFLALQLLPIIFSRNIQENGSLEHLIK